MKVSGKSSHLATDCVRSNSMTGMSQPRWKELYFAWMSLYLFTANSPDIALFKNTTQSSTKDNLDSSRCVDGNRDVNVDHNSCSKTLPSSNPWWQVDLGGIFTVGQVVVTRSACKNCGKSWQFYLQCLNLSWFIYFPETIDDINCYGILANWPNDVA